MDNESDNLLITIGTYHDLISEVAGCAYSTAAECAIGIVEVARQLSSINPISE